MALVYRQSFMGPILSGGFPGQAGNPVGFAATPGFFSLTVWPGGVGTQTINSGANAQSGSGTAGDPWVFSFYDFDALTSGTTIALAHAKFIGCRFQGNSTGGHNISLSGSTDITLSYCSIVPRVSLNAVPPKAAWPSAGADGSGVTGASANYTTYCIPAANCYQYGVRVLGSGLITDHCDFWGGQNLIDISDGSNKQIMLGDTWFHDCGNSNSNTYHQDGPGYLNGNNAPSNVTVNHCTVASISNTNGIAFQDATTPYSNINVTNNYIAGWGNSIDMCHSVAGSTSINFTDNILGNDLTPLNATIYGPPGSFFSSAATRVWRRNTILHSPSTNNNWWNAFPSGYFFSPDGTISSVDWAG